MQILISVSEGENAYSVIGNYILNHISVIEDMIAIIQLDGIIKKELYLLDDDGYYWHNDWWEGEKNVFLLDFFPVDKAENGSCSKNF